MTVMQLFCLHDFRRENFKRNGRIKFNEIIEMISDLYERNTNHNCKTDKCREPPTNISDVKWL